MRPLRLGKITGATGSAKPQAAVAAWALGSFRAGGIVRPYLRKSTKIREIGREVVKCAGRGKKSKIFSCFFENDVPSLGFLPLTVGCRSMYHPD